MSKSAQQITIAEQKANDCRKTHDKWITIAKCKANCYHMMKDQHIAIAGQEANHHRKGKANYVLLHDERWANHNHKTQGESPSRKKQQANHHRKTQVKATIDFFSSWFARFGTQTSFSCFQQQFCWRAPQNKYLFLHGVSSEYCKNALAVIAKAAFTGQY